VANVACWDVMFGCSLYVAESFLADGAGCWRMFSREPQLRLRRVVRPPSFPYVFIGTAWVSRGIWKPVCQFF